MVVLLVILQMFQKFKFLLKNEKYFFIKNSSSHKVEDDQIEHKKTREDTESDKMLIV